MLSSARRLICFVVFPGFELLDLSGPLCAFNVAAKIYGAPYETTLVSSRGGQIADHCGVEINTARLDADRYVDTLIVVGAPGNRYLEGSHDTVELIRSVAPYARRIASVCTGAFLLGEAGLLKGRRATTHWKFVQALQRCYPQCRVEADRIFIKDGPIWTSAGITSGIDLALALIEDDIGVETSKSVARELVVYHRRPGGQSQFSTMLELEPATGRVKNVLAYIREHLKERLTVEQIASAANISPRQFARLFVAETGETPARAIERLRAEAAFPPVEAGIQPIEIIAQEVGFLDPERMRRAFLRIYGQPPQAIRRMARSARPWPAAGEERPGPTGGTK